MAGNPNPSRITDAMWRLWEECDAIIPGVELGGIYAAKDGYHNSVDANKANWPGDYSIELPPDLCEPSDKARAIDLTMGEAEMVRRTGYLKASALDPGDDRLRGLREFIGTVDGNNVTCYIKDSEYGAWRFDGGRDDSHLWHEHISVFTKHCATWEGGLDGVLSVLSGQTYGEWTSGGDDMFCSYGESSQKVEALQHLLLIADPIALPEFGVDRDYGDETAAALVRLGLAGGDVEGKRYGPWEYAQLHALVARTQSSGQPGPAGPAGPPGPAGPAGADGVGVGATVNITGTVSSVEP